MYDEDANPPNQLVDRRRPFLRSLRGLAVVLVVFSLLTGYCLHCWRITDRFPMRPDPFSNEWITVDNEPCQSGYFRFEFPLTSSVEHAWIKIAACDGYEVIVNEDPVARQQLWRPTRPFQNGLSERGQRLTEPIPAMDLNFPREYQWTGFESHRLPVYVDIRPELQRGNNVICIKTESRVRGAKFALDGQVVCSSGARIDLGSSPKWKGEPVPPGKQHVHWYQSDYDDSNWNHAVRTAPPSGSPLKSFDPHIFSTTFRGSWMRHPSTEANSSIVYSHTWSLPEASDYGWLRLATNRHYDLFVNGVRVAAESSFSPDLDTGQWILSRKGGLDHSARPTILDPDEIESTYEGDRFENPPMGDPTTNDFRWIKKSSLEYRLSLGSRKSEFLEKFGSVQSIDARPREDDDWSWPVGVRPQSHQHNREVGGFFAYDVSRLLTAGNNQIEVRLARPMIAGSSHGTPQLAIDGGARTGSKLHWLGSPATWKVRKQTDLRWESPATASIGAVAALPRLQYRCAAQPDRNSIRNLAWFQFATLFLPALAAGSWVGWRLVRSKSRALAADSAQQVFCALAVSNTVMVAALLVRCSFAERCEAIAYLQPHTWQQILIATAIAGSVAFFVDLLGALRLPNFVSVRRLPNTRLWTLLLLTVLTVAFCVRAYRLDYQPLDDDEYASTQAVLSIANCGVPKFAARGVWYTRSPLFHYSTAAFASLFGSNIWALRLPSVLMGMATCWLTYLIGSRLLKNPWIGFAAMTIIALHPFEIFTSHVIRFYQMQQFMALATVYCFCRGFVTDQSSGYRYLTVLCFVATVLCQEASCLIGFSLLLGYLLFADEKSRSENTKLVIASACGLLIIMMDYVVFQARCMTRPAGISPNLEATVLPHFWHPANFFSLFISYSRLHVVASCFLALGLPLVIRERQRNTIALYVILIASVIATNLLVTHVSLRYQYWLIPIWALLSMCGLRAILQRVFGYGLDIVKDRHRHRRLVYLGGTIFFLACMASMSPWRIPGSHHCKLLGDSTGAMQFIRQNAFPTDQIMVTEPHTHAALIEIGRVDYDLSIPLLYDFAVMQEGELVDRNGAAKVISNLQQLIQVFSEHDRVWVAVNREKLRHRSKNLRWEYPGARVELFLRKNCQLSHHTYLWSVYLWDAENGRYTGFREHRM